MQSVLFNVNLAYSGSGLWNLFFAFTTNILSADYVPIAAK